jgi:hypothetical protein
VTLRWYHDWNLQRREIRYQIQKNLDDAGTSMKTQRWLDARVDIDRARLALWIDPTTFHALEIRYFHWQIDRAEARLQSTASGPDKSQYRSISEINCGTSINSLAQVMLTLLEQERYAKADQYAEQILTLDPTNPEAAAVVEIFQNGLGMHAPD